MGVNVICRPMILRTCMMASLVALLACSPKTKPTSQAPAQEPTKKSSPKTKGPQSQYATISTPYGNMVVRLSNATPLHRDNFLKLAGQGYYNGTLFHRVITNFMIQGGDPDSKNAKPGIALGNGGPDYTIPAEFVDSLYHRRGALAAARESDNVNPTKASSGSQFYIVDGRTFPPAAVSQIYQKNNRVPTPEQLTTYETVGGAPHLDGNYTVFGYLVSGFNVLDSIAAQPRDRMDRPLKDVKMTVKVGR